MSAPLFDDPEREQRWRARFAARRFGFPEWALDAPHRALYAANITGSSEYFGVDRNSGAHCQLTSQVGGTDFAALSPDGERIWWFDDPDNDELGEWRIHRWREGDDPDRPTESVAGLPAGYPAGLELGRSVTVIGVADDAGTGVWTHRAGAPARLLVSCAEDTVVAGLSAAEDLVALVGPAEDGMTVSVSVVDLRTGGTLATVEGNGELDAFGFGPDPDQPLLVLHRGVDDHRHLAVWQPSTGTVRRFGPEFSGAVQVRWYPGGEDVLVVHRNGARSSLHRCSVTGRDDRRLPTPPGVVDAAAVRPDGVVEYLWSNSTTPPTLRTVEPDARADWFDPPGATPPPGPELTEEWAVGPAGAVPLLVCPARTGPAPTAFLLHGGPHAADEDRYAAYRSVWVDAGFAVVHVNYRGSTGYGQRWEHAVYGQPGRAELADIGAARDWAVAAGVADPARCVLVGASWGGMLALLGVGAQPELWAAAVAESPIADHAAAYRARPEFLRSFDRDLFGGSPDECPDAYRAASPISYVDQVRAPVLLLASDQDPRSPVDQVSAYADRLAAPHEFYRHDSGHTITDVTELIHQAAVAVRFAVAAIGRSPQPRVGDAIPEGTPVTDDLTARVTARYIAVNGRHPMSTQDDRYVDTHFVPVEQLASQTGKPVDQLRELMLANRLPLPSYLRSDGAQLVPADLLLVAEQAGGYDAMRDWFFGHWEDPAQAQPEWDSYLTGQNVCLRSVTPANMRRKNELVAAIDTALDQPRPADPNWRHGLHALVDELDELELPFTGYDELRFGGPSSRDRYITAVRARYPRSVTPPA